MKALTLTQPWASLMANQQKTIETRSWWTGYRGEIVIHAAKGFPKDNQHLSDNDPLFVSALRGVRSGLLPISRGLCVVQIIGCIRTSEMHKAETILGHKPSYKELSFGNFEEGRFAWLTQFVRLLEDDRPIRGALGLWNWPEVTA